MKDPFESKEFEHLDDPILNFGSGIVIYRQFLKALIVLFFTLSLMVIPVAGIYGEN